MIFQVDSLVNSDEKDSRWFESLLDIEEIKESKKEYVEFKDYMECKSRLQVIEGVDLKNVTENLPRIMEFSVRNKLQGFIQYALKEPALGLSTNIGILKRMLSSSIDYRKSELIKDIIDHCEEQEISSYICGDWKSPIIFIYQQS